MATRPISTYQRGTVCGIIEDAKSTCEELRDELQDWLDNLPENLQGGEKADSLQEAISQLEEAISALEEAEGCEEQSVLDLELDYTSLAYPRSTYMSRAKRLEVGTFALNALAEFNFEDAVLSADAHDAAESLLNSVTEANDAIGSVEFPAMR